MKLHNKKTGTVVDGYVRENSNYEIAVFKPKGMPKDQVSEWYSSLTELNEEWEDYKPAEPLIEDEDIREVVRIWAGVNDLLTFRVVNKHANCCEIIGFGDHNLSSHIGFNLTIAHANKDQFYTIAELCGEEDE